METEVPKNYVSLMTQAYQNLSSQHIIFGRDAPVIISEIWNKLKDYPNRIKLNPTMLLMVYNIISEYQQLEIYDLYIKKFLTYKSKFRDLFPKYNNLSELIDDFVRYLYIYFQSAI